MLRIHSLVRPIVADSDDCDPRPSFQVCFKPKYILSLIQECVQIIFRKACGNNGEGMWSSTRHTCLSKVCVCFTFCEYYGKNQKNHVSLLFQNIHLITRLIVVNSHEIAFLNVMLSNVDEFDLSKRQFAGKAGSLAFSRCAERMITTNIFFPSKQNRWTINTRQFRMSLSLQQ